MEEWKNFNSGWRGRITHEYHIPDMTANLVAQITVKKLWKNLQVTVNADPIKFEVALTNMIEHGLSEAQRGSLGARLAEKLIHQITHLHEKRCFAETARLGSGSVNMRLVEQQTVCDALELVISELSDGNGKTKVSCKQVATAAEAGIPLLTTQSKDSTHIGGQFRTTLPKKQRNMKSQSNTRQTTPGRTKVLKDTKTDQQVATWIKYVWETLTSVLKQVQHSIHALPLHYRLVVYLTIAVALYLTCGKTIQSFLKVTYHVVQFVFWIVSKLLSLLKKIWNWLMDLLGNGSKYKFDEQDPPEDPFVDPFIRSRNIIKRAVKRAVKDEANAKDEAITEALELLWASSAKEMAIHGSDIKCNLVLLWDACIIKEVKSEKARVALMADGPEKAKASAAVAKLEAESQATHAPKNTPKDTRREGSSSPSHSGATSGPATKTS